jgi:hypothetical protein
MGTRIRSTLLAAAVVFGLAMHAAAQPAPLQGEVRDQTGQPLPGVVVTVEHPEETAVRVVLTDLHGQYTVRGLDRSTRYDVEVSHPRFRKTRLEAAGGERVSVRLKPRRSCRSGGEQASHARLR